MFCVATVALCRHSNLFDDTARPQEKQRLETRYMGAEKRAFRTSVIKQVGMSQSATTTCLETLRDLQISPYTRRGHRKTRDSRRDTWKHGFAWQAWHLWHSDCLITRRKCQNWEVSHEMLVFPAPRIEFFDLSVAWSAHSWPRLQLRLGSTHDVAFTIANYLQPSATVRKMARAYGKFCSRGAFWRFQTFRCFRFVQAWHFVTFVRFS